MFPYIPWYSPKKNYSHLFTINQYPKYSFKIPWFASLIFPWFSQISQGFPSSLGIQASATRHKGAQQRRSRAGAKVAELLVLLTAVDLLTAVPK